MDIALSRKPREERKLGIRYTCMYPNRFDDNLVAIPPSGNPIRT